ncbi:MAG: hypothetical protein PVI30_00370 [Myxococcales bacterium]
MGLLSSRNACNAARFTEGDERGHYESYFLRGNHPQRPLGFWIRYTVFRPAGRPLDAVGELWAIHFDGEARVITAVKERYPLSECRFSDRRLGVRVGPASLEDGSLRGAAQTGRSRIGWTLDYAAAGEPLLLLPEDLYTGGFPKAKALVAVPQATFRGALEVDGRVVEVDGWPGSQNHNWGERHTDHYAWGQVAGFDGAEDAFLEVSTARVRLGRVGTLHTPFLTPIVLRVDGDEHRLNSLWRCFRNRGRFDYFDWRFSGAQDGVRVQGRIHAPAGSFVALAYDNPPGGVKTCLNTKIATCELTVERSGDAPRLLHSEHRAAFEILTDDDAHGLPIVV